MSKLRPELHGDNRPTIPYLRALKLIRKAVARRRTLIRGTLEDGKGHYCALGAFWHDNPGTTLSTLTVDQIAAVNDALSAKVSPKRRWQAVMRWLDRCIKKEESGK